MISVNRGYAIPRFSIAVGLLLLMAGVGEAASLSAQDIRRLKKGEIVVRYWKLDQSNVGTGLAMGVINMPPDKVFRVIADVSAYKTFMKRMVESRITRREGKHYYFYYKIDMPWPLSDYWFVTNNIHEVDKARGIYVRRWWLQKGSFARNEGYWYVRRWGRHRSLITYSSVLQPKSAIPQWIINYVTKKALPRAIRTIRQRVYQLKRQGTL